MIQTEDMRLSCLCRIPGKGLQTPKHSEVVQRLVWLILFVLMVPLLPSHSPTPAEPLQPNESGWGTQPQPTAQPIEPSPLGANADVPVAPSSLQITPTPVEDVPVGESKEETSGWMGLDTDWGA